MKQNVIIKSYKDGLQIYLDDSISFAELEKDLGEKFHAAASFFKDAKMVISFEGRVLSPEEENRLIDQINQNSDVDIICIAGKNPETGRDFLRAIKQLEFQASVDENKVRFYKGSLKDGKTLETPGSIVILGDVNPGSSVTADGDVIILGGLYGMVSAGCDNEPGHFVTALDMSPERLRIGGFKYKTNEKPKWSIKPKIVPKIAYLVNGQVFMDAITKELLDSLPF